MSCVSAVFPANYRLMNSFRLASPLLFGLEYLSDDEVRLGEARQGLGADGATVFL
jgi:hypothetical protein